MKRNNAISLARVCAMLLIIACHLSTWFNLNSFVGQFFNVGVQVFLLISGLLYSNREIKQVKRWIINRWLKICLPVLVWIIFIIIFEYLAYRVFPNGLEVLLYLLNLQGMSRIITFFPSIDSTGAFSGCGHLWFVTIIFVCYLSMILIKKIEQDNNIMTNRLFWTSAIICFVGLSFTKISISCILTFYIGYAIGKNIELENKISTPKYTILTLLMVLSILLRIIMRNKLDGTNMYNIVIVGITHTVLAVWILFSIILAYNNVPIVKRIASTNFIKKLDRESYYIYISHNYFLASRIFSLSIISNSKVVQFTVFLILTIVFAFTIRRICDSLTGKINTKRS